MAANTLIYYYIRIVVLCILITTVLLLIYVVYYGNISFVSNFFRSSLGREVFFKYDMIAQPLLRVVISI